MKRRFLAFVLCLVLLAPALAGAAPAGGAPTGSSGPAAAGPAALPDESGRLDVNRASRDELVAVPGIGPSLADAIIALRRDAGPFLRLEDLLQVKGIGEKRLAELERHLFVPKPAAARPTPSAP